VGSRPAGDSQIFFRPYSFERNIIDVLNNFKRFFFFSFKPKVNLEYREEWQFSRGGRYIEVRV